MHFFSEKIKIGSDITSLDVCVFFLAGSMQSMSEANPQTMCLRTTQAATMRVFFFSEDPFGGGGAIGLDYDRPYSPKQSHLQCFRNHVELANLIGLPLLILAGWTRWAEGFLFLGKSFLWGSSLASP